MVCDAQGQSSVEYAVVLAGFLALLVALGLLHDSFREGLFVQHALLSASHHINNVHLGVLYDAFLY